MIPILLYFALLGMSIFLCFTEIWKTWKVQHPELCTDCPHSLCGAPGLQHLENFHSRILDFPVFPSVLHLSWQTPHLCSPLQTSALHLCSQQGLLCRTCGGGLQLKPLESTAVAVGFPKSTLFLGSCGLTPRVHGGGYGLTCLFHLWSCQWITGVSKLHHVGYIHPAFRGTGMCVPVGLVDVEDPYEQILNSSLLNLAFSCCIQIRIIFPQWPLFDG